jgi:AcrR family transcriptional regulator
VSSDGREERGEVTRQALLNAARTAFTDKGYAGASVRDIARAAQAHPALVTYHFGSKANLYKRVIEEAVEALLERVMDALAEATVRRDGARLAFEIYLDHLEEHPYFPVLIQRGVLDGDELVLDVLRPAFAMFLSASVGFSVDLGDDPRGDPRQLFLSLLGATVVPFLFAPLLGEPGETVLANRRAHLTALLAGIFDETEV